MYNSIYPVNINYSKHNQYRASGDRNSAGQQNVDEKPQNQQHTFPDGTKVAIDYSKGQINISQVLTDFRSTILAINAPDDVKDEVNIYLSLVDKESKKENPSREIVVANLKNASRISDAYIATALKKPSNVVEKWIDTLFLQRINLKADPNEVNPDFQLEFPENAKERIEAGKVAPIQEENYTPEIAPTEDTTEIAEIGEGGMISEESEIKITNAPIEAEVISSDSQFEFSDSNEAVEITPQIQLSAVQARLTPFSPVTPADFEARALFAQAKKAPQTNQGDIDAINLLNEALGIMATDENSNQNIRAAVHMERGKIFDSYDYVDYALRDYFEATKADDFNLKAQAHYKSGQIYDEFSEFYPAMDNYLSSIAYSAEADNLDAQARVLSKISSLYTKQFDIQKAIEYGDLAIETVNDSADTKLIATTYSTDAQNSQYLGQNDRAIDSYKNALQVYSLEGESYEQMAYNYEQAAIVMRKLGNHAKAAKLQLKANQCYQRSQQQLDSLEVAS